MTFPYQRGWAQDPSLQPKNIVMAYNPDIHNRKSIRLKGYDYSHPGFYYVTLCTQDRENRFGDILNGEMILNGAGKMVDEEWKRIKDRYGYVILDTYQIMPNHLHGILQITSPKSVETGLVPVPNIPDESVDDGLVHKDKTNANTLVNDISASTGMGTRPIPTVLYDVIGRFKSVTQNDYAFHVRNNGWPPFRKRLWQLRFHDHIIRNQDELERIRTYIIDNPINWLNDQNNPDNMIKNKEPNGL
jgi:putative transposase